MMVFSGYLISAGRLRPVPTFIACLLGSVCGITVSYIIGRTLGLGFVHRYGRYIHVTEQRLDYVHRWFDRIGHWALFVGYYIAGVRHFTAIIAGTSRLELRSFMAYAYSGALVWVLTFLTIGYFVGERWREIATVVHHNLLLISGVVIVLALGYWLYWRSKRKK
jgi:membrane protein DedA with SNARE-associated domain